MFTKTTGMENQEAVRNGASNFCSGVRSTLRMPARNSNPQWGCGHGHANCFGKENFSDSTEFVHFFVSGT